MDTTRAQDSRLARSQDHQEDEPTAQADQEHQGEGGLGAVTARLQAVLELWNRSRSGRMLARYSNVRGGLLAGGIAYTGLFSVFAGLAIGVSVLMATIGRHPAMKEAALEAIDSMLPGVVDDGSGDGLVSIDQLTLDSALNLGSVIGALTLLYSAMGLMGALKNGVRAMFGIVTLPHNPVVNQLANLAGFLVIMVAVVATALASVLTGAVAGAMGFLPDWLSGTGVRLLTLALSFLIDAGVLALIIRLSGPRVPRRDMMVGAALGGLVFGVLRQLGTGAVGSASKNPMLASFAALVVLILWLHLASRVVLYVCAWMANPPRPQAINHPDEVRASQRPNYVTLSVPSTLAWPRQSLTGALEVDTTAHPDYVPPVALDKPEPELGGKKGFRARLALWRYRRAQDKAEAHLARYRQL
ncbi:YihY/virulence factor BrkB family protein [Actinomyces faecalis]|uniref:YihY/virulence factor BrkB family protein n=1 Tax=Actinomyces faecalis TaxID=2722820 RepID=UPI001C132948|nr:YihY/virulence factor BrkB family protein [Actinomyces faecalis]